MKLLHCFSSNIPAGGLGYVPPFRTLYGGTKLYFKIPSGQSKYHFRSEGALVFSMENLELAMGQPSL